MSQEIFFIYFVKKLNVRNVFNGRMRGDQTAALKNGDNRMCLFHAARFSRY